VLLERVLYDPRDPSKPWFHRKTDALPIAPEVAISVKNLGKTFSTSIFGRKKGLVTAIADLTVEIPKFGIFVLVGANG
jgi:ATP-binding cassette subfamily A (ABC1) protein 3